MKFVVLSFLSALFFVFISSCNNQQKLTKTELLESTSDENVLKEIVSSKNKAVYLSFDSLDNDFGSIILLDLISNKSLKLFDNRFYNSSPIFFEKGNKVLYVSAQIGDPNRLKLIRYHAWKQLYSINCNDLSSTLFFSDTLNSGEDQITNFKFLCCNSKTNEIYFSNDDSFVYNLPQNKRGVVKILSIDKGNRIWNLGLSPNNRYLAIEYVVWGSGFGIKIYDLVSNKMVNEMYTAGKRFQFLGWSNDNHPYILQDSIVDIDLLTNSVKSIKFNLDENKFNVKQIIHENENSVLLLVDRLKYDTIVKYNITTSTEIARYNFITKKLDWLTNDGSKKEKLNVFIKQN